MAKVATVRGPVDPSELGMTLFHEHLLMLSPGLLSNWPQALDREAEVGRAAEQLEAAVGAGVRTLVDVTTIDLGRDVGLQREVAERTSMHVVVATGAHLRATRFLLEAPEDRLVALFVDDIERGIGGTEVRAGVLKAASAEAVPPENERLLRCIARAHRATGAPIITHSDALAQTGAEQQRIFADEGVSLDHVVVGHVGDTTDLDYLTALAERGSFLGMDRFGLGVQLTHEERVHTVAALCERGLASQILLSHDAATYYDALPEAFELAQHPDWHFRTIPERVVPELRALGVSEEQIQTMLVDNPRRMLTPVDPY